MKKITIFLHKIADAILDYTSPFSGFYSTITSLPDEQQTLEYVKRKLQQVAEGQATNKEKNQQKPSTRKTTQHREKKPSNEEGPHKAVKLQTRSNEVFFTLCIII